MPERQRECFLTLKQKILFAVNPSYLFLAACLNFSENFENLHKFVAHWREKSVLVCCNPFFYIDWIFHFSRWLNCLFWPELCCNVSYQHRRHSLHRKSKFSGGGTSLPRHGWKAIWTLSHWITVSQSLIHSVNCRIGVVFLHVTQKISSCANCAVTKVHRLRKSFYLMLTS